MSTARNGEGMDEIHAQSRNRGRLRDVADYLPLLGAAALIIVHLLPGSWSRHFATAALLNPEAIRTADTQMDELFESRLPDGNIWLRFAGLDPAAPAQRQFMEYVTYRGTYAAYPRRVYVAPPDTVVNNAWPIADAPELSDALTPRLDIRWRVTVEPDVTARAAVTIERVPR